MAKVPFPADRIHSTTLSAEPKASVLARLADEHPGADRYIFVEDKFGTLEKVGSTSDQGFGGSGFGVCQAPVRCWWVGGGSTGRRCGRRANG